MILLTSQSVIDGGETCKKSGVRKFLNQSSASLLAFFQDNSKSDGSIHLKPEHIVVYENCSMSSTFGIVQSRSRSQHDLEFFLHLLPYKLTGHLSQL